MRTLCSSGDGVFHGSLAIGQLRASCLVPSAAQLGASACGCRCCGWFSLGPRRRTPIPAVSYPSHSNESIDETAGPARTPQYSLSLLPSLWPSCFFAPPTLFSVRTGYEPPPPQELRAVFLCTTVSSIRVVGFSRGVPTTCRSSVFLARASALADVRSVRLLSLRHVPLKEPFALPLVPFWSGLRRIAARLRLSCAEAFEMEDVYSAEGVLKPLQVEWASAGK